MRPPSRNLALVALVAFGLGAGARMWHGAAPSQKSKRHLAATSFDTTANGQAPTAGAANSTDPPADAAPPPPPESRDSVDGILEARGLEQAERLGRFLVSATPADLERLLLGLRWQLNGIPKTMQEAIFLRWMTIDAKGGRAVAGRLNLEFTAWWAWGKANPDAALAAARANPDNRLGIAVLGAIGQSNPHRARLLLEENPRFREAGSMAGLADGLMRTDPAAGATLAAAWNNSVDRENLLTDWARRDPDAAFEWARSLPESSRRNEALKLVMDKWQQRDPDRAASAIESLPDGRAKWIVLAQQAARMASDNPQAALAWVDKLPNESLKREATIEIARHRATAGPDESLALLKSLEWPAEMLTWDNPPPLSPGGATRPALPGNVYAALEMIGASRPAEALDFLSTFPEETQGLALEAICQPWMRRDSMAYSEWLAKQPDGAMRTQAAHILIDRLMSGRSPDFEAAFQWSLTLSEAGSRPMLTRVLSQWREADPDAARAALRAPAVPEDLRSAFDSSASPTRRHP